MSKDTKKLEKQYLRDFRKLRTWMKKEFKNIGIKGKPKRKKP